MGRRRASNDPSVRTQLSDRQREVLGLIAKGHTNGEIAESIGLTLDGVKWHVREILTRLGVDSREEAAAWWRSHGGGRRRFPGWLFGPEGVLVGGAGIAAVGLVVVAVILARASATSSGGTAIEPREQPQLVEIATGEEWRLLVADDGLPIPEARDATLAINGSWHVSQRHVDVLDGDGRIVIRVEVAYNPMALLDDAANTVVISDAVGPSDGPARSRVMVFDLAGPALQESMMLSSYRVQYIIYSSVIALSPDAQWLYWVEQLRRENIVHALSLPSLEESRLAARLPEPCGWPNLVGYKGSAVVVECSREVPGRRQVIDAAAPAGEQAREAPADAPLASGRFRGGYADGLALRLTIRSDGAITGIALVDAVTGEVRTERPMEETYAAHLLDSRRVLLLRSDGTLEYMDPWTGEVEPLPYRLDPGQQGDGIALVH